MEHIILRSKSDHNVIIIQDDLFPGLLTGKLKVFVVMPSGFYNVADLEEIINVYLFPFRSIKITSFLKGLNPELYNQIKYY